jgi:gliding motility-associated-like protein
LLTLPYVYSSNESEFWDNKTGILVNHAYLNTIQHKRSGVIIVLLTVFLSFPVMAQYDSLAYDNTTDLNIAKSQNIKIQAAEDAISIANVFTPNNDGVNDYFLVTTIDEVPLKMNIFTRAGILVYESEGTKLTWDGYAASGQKLTQGIYFYTIEPLGADPDKLYKKSGFFYLYR